MPRPRFQPILPDSQMFLGKLLDKMVPYPLSCLRFLLLVVFPQHWWTPVFQPQLHVAASLTKVTVYSDSMFPNSFSISERFLMKTRVQFVSVSKIIGHIGPDCGKPVSNYNYSALPETPAFIRGPVPVPAHGHHLPHTEPFAQTHR